MPTKLKKPITITLETVEEAVSICHRLNASYTYFRNGDYPHKPCFVDSRNYQYSELNGKLKSQGINFLTWQPPAPLKAGEYDVEVLPNGDLKVGCQLITRAQLEANYQASTDALASEQKEEWPKWFVLRDGGFMKVSSADDWGTYYHLDGRIVASTTGDPNGIDFAKQEGLQATTPAAVSKILGREV